MWLLEFAAIRNEPDGAAPEGVDLKTSAGYDGRVRTAVTVTGRDPNRSVANESVVYAPVSLTPSLPVQRRAQQQVRPAPSNSRPCRDLLARSSRPRATCPADTGRWIAWCRAWRRFRVGPRTDSDEGERGCGQRGTGVPAIGLRFWRFPGGFLVLFWRSSGAFLAVLRRFRWSPDLQPARS